MDDDNVTDWCWVPSSFSFNSMIGDSIDGMNSQDENGCIETIKANQIAGVQTIEDRNQTIEARPIVERQIRDVVTDDETNENSSLGSTSSSSISVIEDPCQFENNMTSGLISAISTFDTNGLSSRNIKGLHRNIPESISDVETRECPQKIRKGLYVSPPPIGKIPRNLFALRRGVDVSTNTEPDVNQRKLSTIKQSIKRIIENNEFQENVTNKKENCPFKGADRMIFNSTVTVCFIFCASIFIGMLPQQMENIRLNKTIATLQEENNLLKREILYSERRENRRLTSLSRIIFDKLEKRESASEYFGKEFELKTFYEKEIYQLKQQVSSLKANYTTLQNQFNAVKSPVNQSITKEKTEFPILVNTAINLKKFSKLSSLFNQQIDLAKLEDKSEVDCLVEFVKKSVNTTKSALEYNFLNYSDNLKILKNYISERDIRSLFSDFADTFKLAGSLSYKRIQKIFLCIEEVHKIKEYKREVEKIKIIMTSLLGGLEESTDLNS